MRALALILCALLTACGGGDPDLDCGPGSDFQADPKGTTAYHEECRK